MTDRELLEAAAKAAGFQLDELSGRVVRRESDGQPVYWNPLTDDGDALRLAVKLGIALNFFCTGAEEAPEWMFTRARRLDIESCAGKKDGLDPYAATRRAIVRAAAEIGRNMT